MTAHEPRSDIRQARYCPKKKRCPKLSHLIILKKKEKKKKKEKGKREEVLKLDCDLISFTS